MASLSFSSLLHSTLYLFISLHTLSSPMFMTANADEGLIQRTCYNTPHHDLCVNSLKGNHSSQETDVVGLALIMVRAAMYSTNITCSQLESLKRGATDENSLEVIELCKDLYGAGASTFLRLAADRLEKHKEYRLAYTYVNTTMWYAEGCYQGFVERDLFYPPLLIRRKVELIELCEIAKSIIFRLF